MQSFRRISSSEGIPTFHTGDNMLLGELLSRRKLEDVGAAKRLSSTGALVQHVAWIDQNGHSSHGNYSFKTV